jgi:hypothetical protein
MRRRIEEMIDRCERRVLIVHPLIALRLSHFDFHRAR